MAAAAPSCWCCHVPVAPELLELLAERGITDRCLCFRRAAGEVPSPCIGYCELDEAGAVCLGCRRTLEEIAGWQALGAVQRAEILLRLRNDSTEPEAAIAVRTACPTHSDEGPSSERER